MKSKHQQREEAPGTEKPSTGQAEMKWALGMRSQVAALLAGDKEISVRLCAVLHEIARMIMKHIDARKKIRKRRHEAAIRARAQQQEEEKKEWEKAKRNAGWT